MEIEHKDHIEDDDEEFNFVNGGDRPEDQNNPEASNNDNQAVQETNVNQRDSSYEVINHDDMPIKGKGTYDIPDMPQESGEIMPEEVTIPRNKSAQSLKPPLGKTHSSSSKGSRGKSDPNFELVLGDSSKEKVGDDQAENEDPNIVANQTEIKNSYDDERPIKPAKGSLDLSAEMNKIPQEEPVTGTEDKAMTEEIKENTPKETFSDERAIRPMKNSYQELQDERPLKPMKQTYEEAVDDRPIKPSKVSYEEVQDERPIKPMKQNFNDVDDNRSISSASTVVDETGYQNDNLIIIEEPKPTKKFVPKSSGSKVQAKGSKASDMKRKTSIGEKKDQPEEEKPPQDSHKMVVEDERPLTGATRSTTMDEERPLTGKGSYSYGNDEQPIRPLTTSSFDEQPIGRGMKLDIPEYPEGMDPNAESAETAQDSGPLANRVKGKVWKTRLNAFTELAQLFKSSDLSDPIFDEYSGELVKFIADSHPGAQEKALEAMKVYVERIKNPNVDPKATVKTLADKAIGPGKPNIKKLANEILCLLFEKCDKTTIFEGLIDSINNKNQKTACAGVQAVVELLANFGAKKLDFLKPFFPHVEKLAGSTVANLRNEAMNFYKEAYKYMGEAIKPFLSKLKKTQIDELEKYFQENPAKPVNDGSSAGGKQDNSGIDPYDIVDPVEIFNKFSESWTEKVLAQAKWSDKKDMLDELLNAASVPKIANSPYQHITSMLKKLLADSNVSVMLCAVKIYGALAKGLRKNFTAPCKIIMPFLLPKLKDKKTQVIEETSKTLDNFLYCITPEDVLEEIKEALADKTPHYKIQVMLWIERYYDKIASHPEKGASLFKSLVGTYKKLVDDGSGEVRDAVLKSLAKFKTVLGDSIIGSHYNDINSTKLAKINELASGSAHNDSKGGMTARDDSFGGPSLKKKLTLTLSESTMEEEKSAPRPQTAKGSDSKKVGFPPQAKPGAGPKGNTSNAPQPGLKKMGSQKNIPAGPADENATSAISAEDAEAKIQELGIPDSITGGLNDNNWKEKVRGISEFNQWISQNTEAASANLEYIFKYLKVKLKDWKESNLNVLKELFQFMLGVAQNKDITLSKKSFSLIASLVINYIAEGKYLESCTGIVFAFVEAVSPKSVIYSLLNAVQDSKNPKSSNPKTLIETCNLFAKLADEITLKFFPLKETIDFGKSVIGNSNQNVRAAATTLFKSIYAQLGPQLNDFLNDVNPQTLKALQAEFEKIVPMKKAECKVKFRGEAEAEVMGDISSNPLDSLPRADISKEANNLLKKLSDKDWKVRNEGLEALESLLAANNNRILPNGLHDLVTLLKTRLNDNNKSQVKAFIVFLGKFATALGSGVKNFSKILVPELVKNLSDKQNIIRSETLVTLGKFSAEIGAENVINQLLPLLAVDNPELRTEVINWVLSNADSLNKAEVRANINPVLSALQDKTKEIRLLAEKLLEKCIGCIGAQPYLIALKDLKPAIQQSLKPIIEKCQPDTSGVMEDEMNASFDGGKSGNFKRTASDNQLRKPQMHPQKSAANLQVSPNTSMSDSRPGTAQPNKQQVQQTKSPKKNAPSTMSSFIQQQQQQSMSNTLPATSMPTFSGIIAVLGQKPKRHEEERQFKWPVDELRDDLIERLKEHLKRNVNPELFANMFSFEPKKHIEAIRTLKRALAMEFQGTIDILDLIIKWFFVRLWYNANEALLKESLDYMYALFNNLEAAKYYMIDFEAEILAPCLVEKLWTDNVQLKILLHKIFCKFGNVYPSQKVAHHLLLGMNSTNQRTRIGSIEVLVDLVRAFGPDIISQKDIKLFAKLLNYHDKDVRESSSNLLCAVGQYKGEELFAIISSDASPQDLEALHNKIKNFNIQYQKMWENMAIEHQNQGLYHPSSPEKIFGNQPRRHVQNNFLQQNMQPTMQVEQQKAPIQNNQQPFKPQQQQQAQPQKMQPETSTENIPIKPNTSLPTINQPTITQQQQAQKEENSQPKPESKPHPQAGKVDEETFDKQVNLLINGGVSNKLDALLYIHDIATSENEENKNFMKAKADMLLHALHIVLKSIFERPKNEIPVKFVFYFLTMAHKLCSVRSLLRYVSEDNLRAFSEEMLNRLLAEDEEKTFENVENESLVKTLNSTMLRILENSNPNDMFSVLFDLLIKNRRGTTYAKVLGLIIKCILKLTKALEQLVNAIQPERILLKSHLYLVEFANESTKLTDDIGIKTIKTILNELVKIYQDKIWDYYAASVQNHPQPDNYIQRWISVILRPINPNNPNLTSPKFPLMNTAEKKPTFNINMLLIPVLNQNDIPEIHQILESMQNPENFEQAAKALYEILVQNPGHSLSPYLKDYPKNFISMVINALERIHNPNQNNASDQFQAPDIQTQAQTQRFYSRPHTTQTQSSNQGQNVLNKSFDQTDQSQKSIGNNLEDFHNKVNNLKMRYGLIMRNENPGNTNTNQNSQGLNMQVLNSKMSALNQMNTQDPENGPKERRFSAASGVGQHKSTENILQKLSEMKMRMASIVNSGNKNPPN